MPRVTQRAPSAAGATPGASGSSHGRPPTLPPELPLRIRVGDAVRRLRAAAGYPSQEAFADAAGVHRTYAGKVERGEVNLSLDSLERLARALGLSAGQLLTEAETSTPLAPSPGVSLAAPADATARPPRRGNSEDTTRPE